MQATGKSQRWAIIGGRKGLGAEFVKALQQSCQLDGLLVTSRKPELLHVPETFGFDFARRETWDDLIERLRVFSPTHVVCFSGGGPYGFFPEKNWRDHEWALQVSFSGPAFLLHAALRGTWPHLRQVCFIGSKIAENSPDPQASSYAAAKHALRGLIYSVWEESNENNRLDIRLASPGYMDTEMLPKSARPRQDSPMAVAAPAQVATEILEWLKNPANANGHLVL